MQSPPRKRGDLVEPSEEMRAVSPNSGSSALPALPRGASSAPPPPRRSLEARWGMEWRGCSCSSCSS